MIDFLSAEVYAVLGVFLKPFKYGYQIYQFLKNTGKKVYPIHPAIKEINGDPCYKTLTQVPDKIEVVDIVVSPEVTEQIARECYQLGINKIWMQPGAESDKTIAFCEQHNIEVVSNACIMPRPLN